MSNYKQLNIHEVRAKFSEVAKQVMSGQGFMIANRNVPFATLEPLVSSRATPIQFGRLRGQFAIPNDFNQPLADFENDFYGE